MRMAYPGTRLAKDLSSPPRPVPGYLIRATSSDRVNFGDSQSAIASTHVALERFNSQGDIREPCTTFWGRPMAHITYGCHRDNVARGDPNVLGS